MVNGLPGRGVAPKKRKMRSADAESDAPHLVCRGFFVTLSKVSFQSSHTMFSRAIKPCAFAAVVLLCLTGALPSCSDTTGDPPAREQTLREYASLMYTCAEDLVYGLDNLFQANWYAKASGDPALQQEIRRKYFSVAELEYDEAAGTIWVNKWRGKSYRITTGGAALDAVGVRMACRGDAIPALARLYARVVPFYRDLPCGEQLPHHRRLHFKQTV